MALPAWVIWFANIRGPVGPPGPPISPEELEEAVDEAVAEAGILREHGLATDLNTIPPVSGVITANASTLNLPVAGGSWTVIHQRSNTSSTAGTQLAISASTGQVWTRRLTSGTWQAWQQIPRLSDLIAVGAVPERCIHVEDGHLVWDARGGADATHYAVHDPTTGRLIATVETFPRPSTSLTSPYLDW